MYSTLESRMWIYVLKGKVKKNRYIRFNMIVIIVCCQEYRLVAG